MAAVPLLCVCAVEGVTRGGVCQMKAGETMCALHPSLSVLTGPEEKREGRRYRSPRHSELACALRLGSSPNISSVARARDPAWFQQFQQETQSTLPRVKRLVDEGILDELNRSERNLDSKTFQALALRAPRCQDILTRPYNLSVAPSSASLAQEPNPGRTYRLPHDAWRGSMPSTSGARGSKAGFSDSEADMFRGTRSHFEAAPRKNVLIGRTRATTISRNSRSTSTAVRAIPLSCIALASVFANTCVVEIPLNLLPQS